MRLLVVDHVKAEREATLKLIPADAHEIKVAQDAATAMTVLDAGETDVVLVESTMTGVTGAELVKRIRARESSKHVYVVVSAARLTVGDVRTAFLVGADDFIRKPFARDELLARIDGPARIRRWASRVMGSGALEEFSNKSDLTSIAAWTSADSSICSELSDMLGFPLAPTATPDALAGSVNVASLPLSLASEHAEVCLAVGIDGSSSAALTEAMFGSPTVDIDAIRDMMREIANVAAGAFKRVAASEGRTFTTGLPSEVAADKFRRPNAKARRTWVGACDKINLRFEVELRVRETKRVRLGAVREGMVVAADVTNQSGGLLVPAGTRITESALGHLTRALGDQAVVEVMEAD